MAFIKKPVSNRQKSRALARKNPAKEVDYSLADSSVLIDHIADVLQKVNLGEAFFPRNISGSTTASAVLVPLSQQCGDDNNPAVEPCIVFNKRSKRVKQPGDLCFPGGRIAPRLDPLLSRFLSLPFFPLARWSDWSRWREKRPRQARRLALLFATSLRESFEEMRLNPLGVRFLGPLPSQSLIMFRRVIYPMVAWIPRQRRFFPNWEVERVVPIPLKYLLNRDHYACYRLRFERSEGDRLQAETGDFPCFLYRDPDLPANDVLWGATYRIVMVFLGSVFGFRPPHIGSLPVVHGTLDETYYNGAE